MKYIILFFIFFLNSSGFCAKDGFLPEYMTPCDFTSKDLVKCILEQMDRSVQNFSLGIPELNVPPLEPIDVDDIILKQPNLEVSLKNVLLHGASKVHFIDLQFEQKKFPFNFEFTFLANLSLTAQYKADAQILVLPIKGDGQAVVNATNINVEIKSTLDEIGDDENGYHCKLVGTTYKYKIESAKLYFENLFKGNQELSENILHAINENWEQIINEFAQPGTKQIVSAAVSRINKFFAAVPNQRLFLNYKHGQSWGLGS